MDSKRKFIKNRNWKKKYQQRNATAANVNRPSKDKPSNPDEKSGEESEDDFALRQPLPKEGWFPESDSSETSDLEDFGSLAKISGHGSIKDGQCDKNWFDKELDSIQVPIDSKNEIIKESEKELKSVSQENVINKYQATNSKIKNDIVKKVIKRNNSVHNFDNEEEELEFLLSLKEPVYTGPVSMKKNIECDRRLVSPITNHTEQKPVKSIDLEKWLDSVLDD